MQDDEAYALRLYQALRARGEVREDALAAAADLDPARAARGLERLRRLGLVDESSGAVEPVEPDTALVRALGAYRENTLAQAAAAGELQQLTQSLLTVYRPAASFETSQIEVEFVSDRRAKDRRLHELNAAITESCDSLHPGGMPPMEVLARSLREDSELVARGVRCRAIYRLSVLQTPKHAHYLRELSATGVDVRLIEHAPYDLLLLDRQVACMPAAPGTDSPATLLIRGSALMNAQVALYEDTWLRAVPYRQALAESERIDLTAQERVVVRLMSGGLSDDQIARKIGVHRRTVQRTVTRLMTRLDASSRFEAGLKLGRMTTGGDLRDA
jgi:DNA-binding NarL/FixJ family response regulator